MVLLNNTLQAFNYIGTSLSNFYGGAEIVIVIVFFAFLLWLFSLSLPTDSKILIALFSAAVLTAPITTNLGANIFSSTSPYFPLILGVGATIIALALARLIGL